MPIPVFSEWLQSAAREEAATPGIADQEPQSAYYVSEMDDFDELCPSLLPDLSFLRPFDAILPWGSFIPPSVSTLVAFLTGGWDIVEWSGLFAPIYPVLWWGPKGTRTGLHYDIERYNILAQIRGSKNVVRDATAIQCLYNMECTFLLHWRTLQKENSS